MNERLVRHLRELIVPIGLAVNVVASISIIQLNKYIYVEYSFPNMALTCIHFIITFLGLLVCNRFQVYQHVEIPIVKMLPMAATFCGFVVLTNLSLQFNAIGTYQCLKIMTIPGVMMISKFYYKHKYSMRVKLSVVSLMNMKKRVF
jgi:solute carrier family 35 protein E3